MSSLGPDGEPLILDPDQLANLWMFDPDTGDSPSRRIGRLATTSDSSLYDLIPFMNGFLEDPNRNYPREGSGVIVKLIRPNGLSSTIGLSFHSDMRKSVLPGAAEIGKEIAASDLSEEEKLQRLANMVGTMIVEAQSFNFGNKSTARAMYGRVRYGRDSIAKGHNEIIDFEPPASLDRLVMLQNLARLRAEQEGIMPPGVLGGVYVDPAIEESLTSFAESLDKFRYRYGKSEEKYINDVDWNKYHLCDELESHIADPLVRTLLVAILFQEDYGPAVCSLVFDGPCDIFESLDAETIVEIVNTNTRLLSMRLKSFMAAAACGGYFISIEDSTDEAKARQITKTKWEPIVSEYAPGQEEPSE